MLSRFRSLSKFVCTRRFSPRLPPFGEDPKQEEAKQMLDEVKESREQKEEQGRPWMFFGTAALLVFGMYYFQYVLKSPPPQTKNIVRVYGEAKIGGTWKLTNEKGESETEESYRGKYIIYYFGFTNCPDICPISLHKLSSAIEVLKKKGKTNIAYLFVSLDPDRDSPDVLGRYTKLFHPEIHGLVVPRDELTEFQKKYKLYSNRVATNDGGYNIDHTSYMYLMDPKGKFVNVLGANLNFEELAQKIEEHMKALEV